MSLLDGTGESLATGNALEDLESKKKVPKFEILPNFRFILLKQKPSVYYSHFQDSMVEQKHSILITPKLTPIVSLQNVKRTFLGHPFTGIRVEII